MCLYACYLLVADIGVNPITKHLCLVLPNKSNRIRSFVNEV